MTAGQPFLQELREFLAFLRSLWGLLAGISILFPLSNVLFTVIPIEGGGNPFQNLRPAVVTTITLLTCVFLTFATFGRRERFANPALRVRFARTARLSFVGALVTLAVYLLASDALYRELITENSGSDTGIAVYDGLFAALYIGTFALITRAFLVLAMLEYFPEAPSLPTAPAAERTDGP